MRLGVEIACRSAHHAPCADESGALLWSGQRFEPMSPSSMPYASAAGGCRRGDWDGADAQRVGAFGRLVPPTRGGGSARPSEQSSDLRDYLAKRTKTDRLDAKML